MLNIYEIKENKRYNVNRMGLMLDPIRVDHINKMAVVGIAGDIFDIGHYLYTPIVPGMYGNFYKWKYTLIDINTGLIVTIRGGEITISEPVNEELPVYELEKNIHYRPRYVARELRERYLKESGEKPLNESVKFENKVHRFIINSIERLNNGESRSVIESESSKILSDEWI